MATKLTYKVREVEVGIDLEDQDLELISSTLINSIFDFSKDRVDVSVYSIDNIFLDFFENFTGYKVSSDKLTTQNQVNILQLDPAEDSQELGYFNGDVILEYSFLKDLFSNSIVREEFFIKEISSDRTEILLSPLNDGVDLQTIVGSLKSRIDNSSVDLFRVNYGEGSYSNILNIDLYSPESKLVAVKLYKTLPAEVTLKKKVSLDEKVIDSKKYEITTESTFEPDPIPVLRGPNFNLTITEDISNPTELLSKENLLSAVTQPNYQIYSLFQEKGISLSIDHSDFSNFIHFSSAEERIRNFKYKLELIESYESSKNLASSFTQPDSSVNSSLEYYNNLIKDVVGNFDHYDRFLFYESGSLSWPKTNNTKPYINSNTTSSEAVSFFNGLIISASEFDSLNNSRLVETIPTFIKDDDNNDAYKLFVDMIGHHFDNLWIYSKAVTDKYDNDNRLDYGISRDLVADALRNFGIKLYGNNDSLERLFSSYTGEFYQTGNEVINTFVSASNIPTSKDSYQKEVYKRIYHNLPLLLKSKGTERGIRALINSFGIPESFLSIRYYGGKQIDDTPYFGPLDSYTSSLERIRVDNTGSITSGETLSDLTYITKLDNKYSQDLHTLEIGFSPTTYIDSFLSASVSSSFNIDNYIGDPGTAYSSSYDSLNNLLEEFAVTGSVERYDLKDFIRLSKFYNNTLFKMIKDFVPARTNLNTGIILKPNILDRSKVKQVSLEVEQPEYTGSLDTLSVTGSNSGVFATVSTGSGEYTTNYSFEIVLPSGSLGTISKTHEEAKYDGELSGSELRISDGELNRANSYKANNLTPYSYVIRPVTEPPLDLRITGVVSHISP